MTAPIGHNGPPFVVESADDFADVPRIFFCKIEIAVVRKLLFDKPLDVRGAFMSALLAMYEHMEPLPADDNIARMRCGIMDMRVYRRVKRLLIDNGLFIEKPSGRISNPLFETAITEYVTEYRTRRDAAKEREHVGRQTRKARNSPPPLPPAATTQERWSAPPLPPLKAAPVTSSLTPNCAVAKPELDDSYAVAKPELSHSYTIANAELKGDLSEKSNKINERSTTTGPQAEHETRLRARDSLITSYESQVKKSDDDVLNHDSARDAREEIGPDEGALHPKLALAIPIVAELLGSKTDPDTDKAYAWVTELGRAYDPAHVLDAALDYDAKRMDGREQFAFSRRVFLDYIRSAEKLAKRPPDYVVPTEKPPERRIVPGSLTDDIVITEACEIDLRNGKQADWLQRFEGDSGALDLALKSVAGRLAPNSPTPLEVQIESGLAKIALERLDRAKNYAKAAQDNAAARRAPRQVAPADPSKPMETNAQRMARLLAEMDVEEKAGKRGGSL